MIGRLLCLLVLAAMVAPSLAAFHYMEVVAKQQLYFASAAYQDDPSACPFVGDVVVTHTMKGEYNSDAIFGFAAIDKTQHHIVMAYRGTIQTSQLVREITDSKETPYPGTPGHNVNVLDYFYKASQTILDDSMSALKELRGQYPTYSVYFTGHSLGAALATILSFEACFRKLVAKPVVYTYGLPRVGNMDFAMLYNEWVPQSYRLVHWHDMVTHMPPCNTNMGVCVNETSPFGGAFGYHISTEVWYQEDMPSLDSSDAGDYTECDGTGEDMTCSDSILVPTSVSDHTNYFGIEVHTNCASYQKLKLGSNNTFSTP